MNRIHWLLFAHYPYRLKQWLRDHQPVQCSICHGWLWRKDAQWEQANTGQILPICAKCHREIFTPFEHLLYPYGRPKK